MLLLLIGVICMNCLARTRWLSRKPSMCWSDCSG